jgi:hypothetical protein
MSALLKSRIVRIVCAFLVEKMTWCKGYSQLMLPVYGGTCLSCKTVHNRVEKRGKCFADDEEVEMEVQKWLRQEWKYVCCGFWCTGTVTGQGHQCWRICREINVFSRFKYRMFYILYPFVTYLLTLPDNIVPSFDHGILKIKFWRCSVWGAQDFQVHCEVTKCRNHWFIAYLWCMKSKLWYYGSIHDITQLPT